MFTSKHTEFDLCVLALCLFDIDTTWSHVSVINSLLHKCHYKMFSSEEIQTLTLVTMTFESCDYETVEIVPTSKNFSVHVEGNLSKHLWDQEIYTELIG